MLGDTDEERALAGDQLYVDLDLSHDNLPAGARIAVGDDVVLEVTAKPHAGCKKFLSRFGEDAVAFVNSEEGSRLRLRGLNARVVHGGVRRVSATTYAGWLFRPRPARSQEGHRLTRHCKGHEQRVPRQRAGPAPQPRLEPRAARTARHLVAVRLPGARRRRQADDTRPFSFGAPAEGPVLPPQAPSAPQKRAPAARASQPPSWRPACSSAAPPVSVAPRLWTSTHDNPVASSPIVTQSGSSAVPAAADSDSIVKVAHNVLPSVVKINVSGSSGSGSGSGIILSADGKILTNNHVASLAGNERSDHASTSTTAPTPRRRSSAPTRSPTPPSSRPRVSPA